MKIENLIHLITRKEIEFNLAKKKTIIARLQLKRIERKLIELEKIKVLILEIAKQAKQEIKVYIENIVTNAIQIVYGKEYTFKMHIEQKRDQEEIYFYLRTIDGTLLEPRKDTCAGGVLDIMSIGLKVAILSLLNAEPILFLDEPLKNLGKYSYIGAQILKELSKEFAIQILLITHDDALMEIADRIYRIGDNNE